MSETMVFHEIFGEVPSYLLRALKRAKVTPAEFYMMETMGLAGRDMWEHIRTHTVGGEYHAPLPGEWS